MIFGNKDNKELLNVLKQIEARMIRTESRVVQIMTHLRIPKKENTNGKV